MKNIETHIYGALARDVRALEANPKQGTTENKEQYQTIEQNIFSYKKYKVRELQFIKK